MCGGVAAVDFHTHACRLPRFVCRETKRSKGVAYVQFQIPEDAVKAAQQLDGTIFQVGHDRCVEGVGWTTRDGGRTGSARS